MTIPERKHQYYLKNKEKIIQQALEWQRNNPEAASNKVKRFRKRHPWLQYYYNARARCNVVTSTSYPNYGGRGIKFLMSKYDFKFLWFRDRADLLRKPSIDRKNSSYNYTYDNCRFIELHANISKTHKGLKKLKDKQGRFIKSR